MITIRKATLNDLDAIRMLFRDTITKVASKDYTAKQVAVWSSSWDDVTKWENKFKEQEFFVAIIASNLAGFTSLLKENYIDHLYVSSDYQGLGVATELLTYIENIAINKGATVVKSDVSITARPFFESKGYQVVKENTIPRDGEVLINYDVIKVLN